MDIKDSYLHSSIGVVKSISVDADKLTYNLADVGNTAKTITLPLATTTANGLLSSADKAKLDNLSTTSGDCVTISTDQQVTGVKTFTKQQQFAVEQGTAPFTVTSTTKVANLNSDYLDGISSAGFIRYNANIDSSTTNTSTAHIGYGYDSKGWKSAGPAISIGAPDGYIMQMQQTAGGSTVYVRYGKPDGFGDWKQVAFTDSNITGNAATADKLKTARKLWGQDFDGSSDVSGALYGVTTITATEGLVLQSSSGNIYLRYNGDDNSSICLIYDALVPTTASHNKLNLGRAGNLWKGVYASNFYGNLNGSYINALTGYTKATSASDLTTADTLNTALGKLEYKSDYAYDWITNVTATDTDEYINKWGEIVDFLDSVKEGTDILDEFVTRKTDQIITGQKNFNTKTGTVPVIISREGASYEALSIGINDSQAIFEYTNDEKANSYVFKMVNTDVENSDGGGANTSQVIFNGSDAGSSITATTFMGKFLTTGGTSSQFVKGDGSLDSNSYLKFNTGHFTPKTECTISDVLAVTGYNSITKSAWSYANNGYLPTKDGYDDENSVAKYGNIDLAGATVLTVGSQNQHTQLYITAPASSGTSDVTINDVLLYQNHGSDYLPGWTRILTDRTINAHAIQHKKIVLKDNLTIDANTLTDPQTLYYPSGDLNSKTNITWNNFPDQDPPAGGFSLLNIQEGGYKRQIYGHYSRNTLYVRCNSYKGSGVSWSEWKQLAGITDIPTKLSQLTNDSGFVTGGPYLPTAGGTMTGNITVYTGADGRGLVFGTSKLNSLSNQLIWQSSEAIRFGSSSWDWNSWAGLKYDSANKIVYLGIPDNIVFNANTAQSGGKIKFPGVASLYMGSTNLTESALNVVNTAGGKDLGLIIQGTQKKIGFMIGSGNSNNGWYDFTSGVDKWIMYRSSNAGNVIFNYPVQASKFVGDVTGNATSATKATQDGDGNTISSTYFKKLSRPDAGFNIDEIELFGMRDIQASSEITRTGRFPFEGWGSLMSFNGQNYFVQLATQGTSSGMYFRSAYGGGVKLTDKPWVKFLDSSNYTEYTVKKDGTGASGTWGINITGSSNSASYANRLTEYHNLDRQHDSDVIEPWNMPLGIMIRFKNPTGAAASTLGSQWNTIVSMNGFTGSNTSGAGYRHEFLFSDSLNHNDGTFYVRNGVDDLWNDWVKVVTAKNYKDAIPTVTTSAAGLMSTSDKTKLDAVDSTYLKLTGGQISSSATTPLSINSTSGTESGLRFDVNKVSSGWVGYDTTNGVQLFSYKGGNKVLGIKDDGTPHFSGNILLHGQNYTNYTVKKDGTGATGTWGISITGSSSSCTGNAATATCIQKPNTNATELPTGTTICSDGMKFVRSVYNTVNRPATYGNVIQIGGSGHSQLFLEWSGSSATTGKVYYKSKRDVSTTEWGDWVQLIDERDVVTTSKAGLMSAADKTKLDGITGSVTNNLVIKLNSGTTEGTNLFTFNGSAAKTINITPASINALASNGTASAAIRLSSKGDNTNANTLCFYSASISSTTLSAMNSWTRPTDGSNNAMVLRMYKTANTGHDIYAASDKDSLWHRNSSNATSKWAKILDSQNCYGIYKIWKSGNNIHLEYISGKQYIPNVEVPIYENKRAMGSWPVDTSPAVTASELIFLAQPVIGSYASGNYFYYSYVINVTSSTISILPDTSDPNNFASWTSEVSRVIIFHL